MTEGTVTVSHSLAENSSVAAPAAAAVREQMTAILTGQRATKTRTMSPAMKETINMAAVPSQDFFPFTGESVNKQT